MKFVTISIIVVITLFGELSSADATIVELPLSCEGKYDIDSPNWQTEFDLGVEFVEIESVYMDWSGEITAELVMLCGYPDKTKPIDALFVAKLYESDPQNYFARAYVQTGADTYPDPKPFELQSVFTNDDWSALLDGKARIEIWFGRFPRLFDLCTVEYPSAELRSATLVFEGIVIPEPTTFLLLVIGMVAVRAKHQSKLRQ